MADDIDVFAATPEQALMAKVLREHYPTDDSGRHHVKAAAAALLALDEYTSDQREPPEPPNFSTVRVGGAAFVRNDGSGGANWLGPGGWFGWPALCETAMTDTGFPPVLLVPDPVAEAPDLPWRCGLPGGDIFVGPHRNDSRVWVKVTDQHDESGAVPIAASVAREMGLALLKAAQQQNDK